MRGPRGRVTRGLRHAICREDRRLWGVYALMTVWVLHLVRYASAFKPAEAATHGDGFYTWIYARSLAFDFDIDLTNDYALCGDPFNAGVDEGGHRPANPLYFGPALFLAPVLFVMKTLVRLAPDAPPAWSGGCTGPIVYAVGFSSVVATWLTVWIGYRVARRFFGEGACAIGALVVGLASPLNVFGTLTWYYSHLWAALAVAIAFLASFAAHEDPDDQKKWLWCGLACGLAALMRPQEALWLALPLASIATHARSSSKAAGTRWRGKALWQSVLVAAGFVVVYTAQLFVYARVYGSPFVIPQGKLYVQLSHAHPWLLLFGARSGLLYWTPLMWLAVLGIPRLVLDRRLGLVGAAIVLASAGNVYVSSAALSWTGSGTLGARVQTSLAVPLLLGAAASSGAIIRWAARRRMRARATVLVALAPWVWITWSTASAGLPNDRVVVAPDLYAAGTRQGSWELYRRVGNPWTLPASLVFAARYRMRPRVLDELAADGMWVKHYRTLETLTTDTLTFAAPPPA